MMVMTEHVRRRLQEELHYRDKQLASGSGMSIAEAAARDLSCAEATVLRALNVMEEESFSVQQLCDLCVVLMVHEVVTALDELVLHELAELDMQENSYRTTRFGKEAATFLV